MTKGNTRAIGNRGEDRVDVTMMAEAGKLSSDICWTLSEKTGTTEHTEMTLQDFIIRNHSFLCNAFLK